MIFSLTERLPCREQKVVIVDSLTFQSFVFVDELGSVLPNIDQAEFGLADNSRDFSRIGVESALLALLV